MRPSRSAAAAAQARHAAQAEEHAARLQEVERRSAARLKIAGEKQKALSDAERAVQLAPDYAKAHFRRGQALRALGEQKVRPEPYAPGGRGPRGHAKHPRSHPRACGAWPGWFKKKTRAAKRVVFIGGGGG